MEYNNTTKLIVKSPADFIDYAVAFFSVIGIISCFLSGNYLVALIVFSMGLASFNCIRTGKRQINVIPLSFSRKDLFEVKDDKDNTVYIVADSIEEANMFCELERVEGKVSYIGKARCFI